MRINFFSLKYYSKKLTISTMIEFQDLLKTFLPKWIDWNRYFIKDIKSITDNKIQPFIWRVEFFIEEKNIIPESLKNNNNRWSQIISKWFYPEKKIHDFPVRDKIWTIIIKRRRWILKDKNQYISQELDIVYPNTLSEQDFLSFLK